MGRWRWAAIPWLLIALLCAAYVGVRVARGAPIESDLLALLPPTERNATAEAAVKALSDQLGNRVLFLVGHDDAALAKAMAQEFAARLKQSAAFARVIDTAPPFDVRQIGDSYAAHRMSLLTAADRELLASPAFDAEAMLLHRLHQPFQIGVATDLALDPFGFQQHWLARIPLLRPSGLGIEDGVLVAHDGPTTYVLIIAEPGGSAFDPEIQAKVVAAVGSAEAAIKARAAQVELVRGGALFYGEAARSSAQAEVDFIGGGSLCGILLLMWLLFRSLRPLVLGMATVAIGIACGAAAVLASHGKIHLITLVFGASLIGEAVDYAIQYFAAHLDAGQDWQPAVGLRRVLSGLTLALATSLIGYGALTLTPFPAISQIALFAFAGLAAAWLSVLLLLPQLVRRPSLRNMNNALMLPRRILALWRERFTCGGVLLVAVAIVIVSIPGWLRLAADDDVRQLISRPAHLTADEALIRRLAGVGGSGRFFLVEGRDDEEALARDERLAERLRPQIGRGISAFSALSDFVPAAATQMRNSELLAEKLPADKMVPLFAQAGLRESVAATWADALRQGHQPLSLAQWRQTPLARPVLHQILSSGTGPSALLLTLNGDDGSLDLAAVAAGLPGVTVVDKAAGISALFAEYRRLAALWLPLAVAIVLALLAARYGLRQALAVLLPTLLAMGATMAIYGYSAVPLTLFTLLGLVLVLGVGVNYAIFVVEAGDRAPAPFAGVLLSAATTILSFGLLSLSSMPALHQFGLVLLSGVACSVLFAPMALTLGRGKTPCA